MVRFTALATLVPEPVSEPAPLTAAVLVRLKLAEAETPDTLAVTEYAPVVLLAVSAGAVATPLALVAAVAVRADPGNVAPAPLEGAVKVTVTLFTGLPKASLTVACNAVANVVLTVALCGVPSVAAMLEGGPAVLVRLKLAEIRIPDTLAVTEYVPTVLLAVKVGAAATPLLLVVLVAVRTDPGKVPLAPLEGAVKVTVALFTGLPAAFVTVTCRGVVNALLMLALCGVPSVAVTLPVLLARAAAFRVTFPVPVAMAHVNFNV